MRCIFFSPKAVGEYSSAASKPRLLWLGCAKDDPPINSELQLRLLDRTTSRSWYSIRAVSQAAVVAWGIYQPSVAGILQIYEFLCRRDESFAVVAWRSTVLLE